MPRAPGQIDEHKTQAVLKAAVDLFARKGAKASMAEIARLAGVSKQTLYNRFPSKSALAKTLLTQRSMAITAPLDMDASPQEALARVAEVMLSRTLNSNSTEHLRALAMVAREDTVLAHTVYEAGPARSLSRIADWLRVQHQAGRLHIETPEEAAEIFVGMVLGNSHLRTMLGLPAPDLDPADHAREAATRFVRAYAP